MLLDYFGFGKFVVFRLCNAISVHAVWLCFRVGVFYI